MARTVFVTPSPDRRPLGEKEWIAEMNEAAEAYRREQRLSASIYKAAILAAAKPEDIQSVTTGD